MSFKLPLSPMRRPLSGLIRTVGVLALLCAIAAPAQAQTRPRVPALTCSTHPAIINTAIDGSTGYNNSSSPVANGAQDEHWDWANSKIQYPTNIGLNYPQNNIIPGRADTDQPYVDNDPIGVLDPATGKRRVIKNPQDDIDPVQWSVVPRYTNSAWQPSPFNNAQWIGGVSLPRGTTFLRYQFDLNDPNDVANFAWNFDYMTDDNIRQVYVNGVPQLPPPPSTTAISTAVNYGGGFSNIASMSLRQNWQQGRNVVVFSLWNYGANTAAYSPSGLLIQASGASFCGSNLQVNKYVQKGAGFSTTSLAPFSGTVAPNSAVYYNIRVSNQSSTALKGVVLNDPIPPGLSTSAGFSWQCRNLSGSAPANCTPFTYTGTSLNLPDIPANGSLMLVLTARTAAAPLEPVITNTATAVPPAGSPSGICTNADGTNGCTSSASISTGAYVSIKKSLPVNQPGPFYPGDQVKYLLSVVNEGSVDVAGVTLNDKLPADLSNGQWTCTVPADSFATCPATTSGAIDASGNFVGLTGGFPLRGQSNLLFTVTGTVGAVAQTKVVPNTASITAAGGGAQCWNGSTANPKSNVLPCNSTVNVTLLPPTPVALVKTQTKTGLLYAGDTQSYSVTVTNNGKVATTGTLADALPAGMTLVDQSCAITPATTPPTPACSLNTAVTLPAGSTLTYTLNTTVGPLSAPTQPIVNQATWTPAVPAHTVCTATPQSASVSTCTAEVSNTGSIKPVLDITAEVVPNTNVPLGASVTYAVTATNTSAVNAPNVNVQAGSPSPAGSVTFTGNWTCDAALSSPGVCNGYVPASGDLNATLGSLPAGQKAVFTRTGLVSATLAQGAPVVLTAMDTTNPLLHTCYESAETQANGSCQTTVTLTVSKPALSITNSVAPSTDVNPGQTVNYTVVVTNSGGVGLADAKVDIGAVTGITPVSITSCSASPAPAACPVFGAATGGTIGSTPTGVLPVGASYTIVVSAKVDTTAPFSTTLSMPATVSTAAPGLACTVGTPVGTNACQANVPLTTSAAPKLSISNVVSPTTAAPGADVSFTIIAKNESGSPITDGAVSTDTPANITLGTWTCAASGGAVCPAAGGSGALAQTGANMPVGGTLTYTLAGKIKSDAPDAATITLNANIASAVTGNNCPAGTATAPCTAPATVTVNFVPPVLSITNTASPTTAAPDADVSFKIVVTNTLGKKLTDGVVAISTASTDIDLGAWTCVASAGSTCPSAGGSGALPVQNGATIELNGTLTYTLNGKIKTAADDGATITMNASINSSTTGVTCASGALLPCKAPSTVTVDFVPPVLSIINDVAPTSAAPDDEVTFTIVAKNTLGKRLTDGVITTDTPANITLGDWTCTAADGAVCPVANGSGALNYPGANMPAGGTLTFLLKATINSDAPVTGTITLNAYINSATSGVTCASGAALPCTDPADVTLKPKPPVLAITNTADKPSAAPGDEVTFTIIASNHSTTAVTDGRVVTDVPTDFTLGAWTCTASGGATCPEGTGNGKIDQSGASLPAAGGTLTYVLKGTINATAQANTDIVLNAQLFSSAPGVTCEVGKMPCTDDAKVTVKLKPPVIAITNFVDKPTAEPNDVVTFKIVASNNSPTPITDGKITTDAQPANIELGAWTCTATGGATCPSASGSGALDVSNASLPANGGTLTYELTGTIKSDAPNDAVIPLTAYITSGATDVTCLGGTNMPCSQLATVKVKIIPPVLALTNDANPKEVAPGEQSTFTITVTNQSGSPIIDGTLTTTAPTTLTMGAWSCSNPTKGATCPVMPTGGMLDLKSLNLPVGGSLTLSASGTLASTMKNGQSVTLTAELNTGAKDATCAGATSQLPCVQPATVTVKVVPPVLFLDNVVNKSTAAPGERVTFTVTASNLSGSAITDGRLVMNLPANFTPDQWSCQGSGTATCAPGQGDLPINQSNVSLPVGGTLTYIVSGTISSGALNGAIAKLDASISSAADGVTCQGNTPVPCAKSQSVIVKVPVIAKPPVLELTNNPPVRTVAPGAKTVFTLVASNATDVAITDATLTTDQPANLTLGNWTCKATAPAKCPAAAALTKASGPLNVTGLSLPVGGALTYTAEGTLASTLNNGDSVTLTATLSSPTAGSKCKDDAATCVRPAKVNIRTAGAVGGDVKQVPVDSIWMLAALASLMLAAAAVMQRRTQRADKAQRK